MLVEWNPLGATRGHKVNSQSREKIAENAFSLRAEDMLEHAIILKRYPPPLLLSLFSPYRPTSIRQQLECRSRGARGRERQLGRESGEGWLIAYCNRIVSCWNSLRVSDCTLAESIFEIYIEKDICNALNYIIMYLLPTVCSNANSLFSTTYISLKLSTHVA